MKTIILSLVIAVMSFTASAQVKKVSLQAAGLTCSMCSKAVLNALQKVSFVDKVDVDLKNQEYGITFKEESKIEFDALTKAVEDAGFSVAGFKVKAELKDQQLKKDEHILIGNQYFHFLNAKNQQVKGLVDFTIVDKAYTSAKNYKKYSSLSKMECVQTGRTASCCTGSDMKEQSRIYHAIL